MAETSLRTASGKLIKIKMAEQKFQAICTGGPLPICSHIGSWFGPERNTEDEAKADRDEHKKQCPNHDPEVVQW